MIEDMDTRLMCIFGIETRNSYEENRKIYEDYLSNISFFFRYIVKMCSVTQSCSTP